MKLTHQQLISAAQFTNLQEIRIAASIYNQEGTTKTSIVYFKASQHVNIS